MMWFNQNFKYQPSNVFFPACKGGEGDLRLKTFCNHIQYMSCFSICCGHCALGTVLASDTQQNAIKHDPALLKIMKDLAAFHYSQFIGQNQAPPVGGVATAIDVDYPQRDVDHFKVNGDEVAALAASAGISLSHCLVICILLLQWHVQVSIILYMLPASEVFGIF